MWLQTPHPANLIQALYRARAEANDPRLNNLSLRASRRNPTREVWIVKKAL